MKVVCKSRYYENLIYEKIYNIMSDTIDNYYCISSMDTIRLYRKDCFITLDEYREEQISKILGDV